MKCMEYRRDKNNTFQSSIAAKSVLGDENNTFQSSIAVKSVQQINKELSSTATYHAPHVGKINKQNTITESERVERHAHDILESILLYNYNKQWISLLDEVLYGSINQPMLVVNLHLGANIS